MIRLVTILWRIIATSIQLQISFNLYQSTDELLMLVGSSKGGGDWMPASRIYQEKLLSFWHPLSTRIRSLSPLNPENTRQVIDQTSDHPEQTKLHTLSRDLDNSIYR